jgi:hypothetical protein
MSPAEVGKQLSRCADVIDEGGAIRIDRSGADVGRIVTIPTSVIGLFFVYNLVLSK